MSVHAFLESPSFTALRRAFEDAPIGAAVLDDACRIRWVNGATGTLTGRAPEDLVGRHVEAFGVAEPGLHAGISRVHAGASASQTGTMRLDRADGGTTWVRLTATPLADGLALALLHDVTEQRATATAHHGLLHSAPVAILTVAPGGRITLANPEAERVLGYEPGALVGTRIEALVPPEHRRAHPANRAAYTAAPEVRRIGEGRDVHAIRGDGRRIEVEASLSPAGDGTTQVILIDVTERKRAEAELRRLAAREHAVAVLGERALEGASVSALEQLACDLAAQHLQTDITAAVGGTDGLVIRAGVGLDRELLGAPVSLDGTAIGAAPAASAPVAVADLAEDPGFPATAHLRASGAVSAAAVLIGSRRDALGILLVASRERREFSQEDLTFLRSVANVLGDATRRHKAEAAIRHQALHDPVTGLPNRSLVMERIRHWLDGAAGTELQGAVIVADLDQLTVVNDALGHHVGDDLLRAVGARLRHAVRPTDTVARLGAGGFVMFCPDVTGEADALEIAGRITEGLREPFRLIGGHRQPATASLGVALTGKPPLLAEDVVRNADSAMYRAKRDGRNRTVLFSAALHDSRVRRRNTELELREALDRGDIDVHFQPIVAMRDGEITGLEALARWTHAERGPVSPAEFVPVAESAGLVGRLGAVVLRAAAREVAGWNAAGYDVFVSVNLSALQVTDPATLDLVRDVLAETGISGDRLAFEITETAVLADTEAASKIIDGLRATGARVKLDDFGTGYSSLSHLRALPLDCIKVDRSFVASTVEDPSSRALLAAIAQLAAAVGADLIAEGVETVEQHAMLRALGCGFAQGYLYGRPAPADAVPARLAQGPTHSSAT